MVCYLVTWAKFVPDVPIRGAHFMLPHSVGNPKFLAVGSIS